MFTQDNLKVIKLSKTIIVITSRRTCCAVSVTQQRSKLTFSKSRFLATFNCKMVVITRLSPEFLVAKNFFHSPWRPKWSQLGALLRHTLIKVVNTCILQYHLGNFLCLARYILMYSFQTCIYLKYGSVSGCYFRFKS